MQWRLVTPSQAGNAGVNATNRYVPHLVTAQPTKSETDVLRVFLPGTGSQPGASTYLLRSIAECNRPTIGLSYSFLPFADATRNELCFNDSGANESAHVDCLARQHSDCIWGSEPGYHGLWPAVAEQDSVVGRLRLLLAYLDAQYPEEDWARFLDGTAPRWDRIMMSGHSQGAGHTGYLAQTTPLAAAVLISGPQDECIDCADGPDNLWLAQPWATTRVTAAANILESASDVIQLNWVRMVGTLGWPEKPTDVGESASVTPPYGAALSAAPYDPQYTGPRPYHCSMAGDGVIPMTLDNGVEVALYGEVLWPALYADPPAANAGVAV